MRLIVGLGNPGPQYAGNRHNIGFLAIEDLRRHYGFGPERARFQGEISEGAIGAEKCLALRPLTYMNESGRAVRAALDFFKLVPGDVIVIHDEIDLPLGKLRAKKGGGTGGHNGLRSIDAHIGPDYWRLRLGIGHPGERSAVRNFVLADFAKAEAETVDRVLAAATSAFPLLVAGEENRFLTKTHLLLNPKPPKPEPGASGKSGGREG